MAKIDPDRLASQAKSVEHTFVGRLLLYPQEYHDHDLDISEFSDAKCRRLYDGIGQLWSSGTKPDPISLEDWTRRTGGLTLPAEEILRISDASRMSVNMAEMAAMIRDNATDREVRKIASSLIQSDVHGEELLAKAMGAFNDVGKTSDWGWRHIRDVMDEILINAERSENGEDVGDLIYTGVSDLDSMNLLERGGVLIIAGRPSMGKTAFARYLTRLWAANGERIGVFSTETSDIGIGRRHLSRESGVPYRSTAGPGPRSSNTWRDMQAGASELSKLGIWIDHRSNRRDKIVRAIRRGRQRLGLTIVVLDFLQKCIPYLDPVREINQLMAAVIDACREDPPIGLCVLSQLNRQVERRPDKVPRLSDLKESGRLEEDADTVVFPFRGYYYEERGDDGFKNRDPRLMQLLQPKARNDALCRVNMEWDNSRGHVVGPRSARGDEPQSEELDFGGGQ